MYRPGGQWLVRWGCCLAAMGCDGASYVAEPCVFDEQHWLVEGETLRVPLRCEHAELIDPPAGLELDRETRELRWTPTLDQAANYVVELQLGARDRGVLRVGVADRFEDPDNVPVVDALQYTHELGLPVFHIGAAEDINQDDYTPATLSFAGESFEGAQAKYRGATSRKYPKRSFTLKLDKDARFRGARRIVLTSTFDDNSQLRQRLAFELWNALDDRHIAIQHFSAVVYVNGSYQGVYAVTDHLNDDFLESLGFPQTVNLYKARSHDANLRLTDRHGKPKKDLAVGYTKEEGAPGDNADLLDLVSWIATAPDAEFREQVFSRLAPDFEHWMLFVTMLCAVDTTNKNYYLVHDASPDAPDARWRFAPWDFNASFGQDYRTGRRALEDNPVERFATRSNGFFERIQRDPSLREHYHDRLRGALAQEAAVARMLGALDRFAEEVHDAALRDELRWDAEQRAYFSERADFVSHEQEIAYIRAWITERWAKIAAEL